TFPLGGRDGRPAGQTNQDCCNWDDANAATLNAAGTKDNRDGFNWRYWILPYIEQGNLFDTVRRASLYATPVKIYYCPSRRGAEVYSGGVRCDYNGNAGLQFVNGTPTNGSAGSGTNGVTGTTETNDFSGLVLRSNVTPVSLERIPDGSSNTVLVAEK